jgi:hypothetical protein
MKVYKNIQALWQAPAGTANPIFHAGQALAIRLVPNFLTSGNLGTYLPRTILATDNVKRNNQFTIGDSGWFLIDRNFLQTRDDDSDHPFSRTVGPRASLAFGIESIGAATSDNWNVWIAEDLLDLMAGPAPIVQLQKDVVSGLFFPFIGSQGQQEIIIQGTNVAIPVSFQDDSQIFDQTAAAGAAISTGTIGDQTSHDYLVRITGLTAPTTRTLTYNAVRANASVVALMISPTIGATVTDIVFAIGEGANMAATPLGTTSLGYSFAGPPPITMNWVLSAGGADTPRMTIWQRQQS